MSKVHGYEPGLLIIGASTPSRPIWFEAAKRKGLRTYFVHHNATWERDYCEEIIDFSPQGLTNIDELTDAVIELSHRHRIDGVFSPIEFNVITGAYVAHKLGLPGLSVDLVSALRNKSTMREMFAKASLPSAQFKTASSPQELADAAVNIGFPVVVKPAHGAGSIGVTRVNEPTGLESAYHSAERAAHVTHTPAEFVVEEYLEGSEVSIEAVMVAGEVVWQAITCKPQPMEGPHFAEMEFVTPPPFPRETQAELLALNAKVMTTLGITVGVTHTEYRLTAHGPRLVEINPRVAGQQIPKLYQKAWRVDLVAAAIDCALGHRSEMPAAAQGYAGYRCLDPGKPGIFHGLTGVAEANAIPHIYEIAVAATPGQYLGVLPDVVQIPLGYVFAHAETYDDVRTATATAQQCITIQLQDDGAGSHHE